MYKVILYFVSKDGEDKYITCVRFTLHSNGDLLVTLSEKTLEQQTIKKEEYLYFGGWVVYENE